MSFKIGRVNFKISFLFTVLLALIIVFDKGYMLCVFLFMCAHECSHLAAMLLCGAEVTLVSFEPFGIIIQRQADDLSYIKNILIISAGCFFNLIACALFYFLYLKFGFKQFSQYSAVNFSLFVFNTLPLSGLDGGALLSLITEKHSDAQKAHKTLKYSTFFTCGLLFVLGAIISLEVRLNPSIFLVSLYFFIHAVFSLS